jgi:hypothetical protein
VSEFWSWLGYRSVGRLVGRFSSTRKGLIDGETANMSENKSFTQSLKSTGFHQMRMTLRNSSVPSFHPATAE